MSRQSPSASGPPRSRVHTGPPGHTARGNGMLKKFCHCGWNRRAGRLHSTAARRFIPRKTFRHIQKTRVPDARMRVSTGPAASGSTRVGRFGGGEGNPDVAHGHARGIAHDLPGPGYRHHPGCPSLLSRSWNRQPTKAGAIGCRAHTFGCERLAAMAGRAAGFVPGPGRTELPAAGPRTCRRAWVFKG